jgi:AcrR family transcriptional regulator
VASEPGRVRNPRGQGSRLRAELVAAATALLEEGGSEEAVTLRGVARRAGVTAPSVYAHFSGPGAILQAVVDRAFAEFHQALTASGSSDLRSLCAAYLDFARTRPQTYRVMFGRHRREGTPEMTDARELEDLAGSAAFGLLVEAVAQAATSTGRDPSDAQLRATRLWVGLHGYASLRESVPAFPWPSEDAMFDLLLEAQTSG